MPTCLFTLDQFHIDNTRALHEDTDVVSFSVKVGGRLLPPVTKYMGDVNNGDHRVGLAIGPVEVPDDSQTQVAIGYAIVNSGFNGTDEGAANKVLNRISDAAAALCTAEFGFKEVWDALNKATQWLNGLMFVNCDGPVAGDAITVTGDTISRWLAAGGHTEPAKSYAGSDSPGGCGSNSQYTVTWSAAPATFMANETLLGIGMDHELYTRTALTSPWVEVPNSGSVLGVVSIP
jgi:hypothetical protein